MPGTEAALVAYSTDRGRGGQGQRRRSDRQRRARGHRHPPRRRPDPDGRQRPARRRDRAAEQALSSSTMALDDLDSAGKHTSDRRPRPTAARPMRSDAGVDAATVAAPTTDPRATPDRAGRPWHAGRRPPAGRRRPVAAPPEAPKPARRHRSIDPPTEGADGPKTAPRRATRARPARPRRRSGVALRDAARCHRCRTGLHGPGGRNGGLLSGSPCRREPRPGPRSGLVPAAGRAGRPGRRRGRRGQPPPPRPLHRPRPAAPLPALREAAAPGPGHRSGGARSAPRRPPRRARLQRPVARHRGADRGHDRGRAVRARGAGT